MAELDLLSAEGYDERALGLLTIRVAAIEPPTHPLGPEYSEPHWGVFASARNVYADLGWLALYAGPNPDSHLETLDDEAQLRTERLSICIGTSWKAIAASALFASRAQEQAVFALPHEVYGYSLDELRSIRAYTKAVDPVVVATLLQMTYHWAHDNGGTLGPRFA